MGTPIPASWEYYVPDPEIEELLEGEKDKDGLKRHIRLDYKAEANRCFSFHKTPGRRNGKVTDEVLAYLRDAYAKGTKYNEMAKHTGLCQGSVHHELRKMGLTGQRLPRIVEKEGVCKNCHRVFPRYRTFLVFCSVRCAARYRWANWRKRAKRCRHCNRMYRQSHPASRCCSEGCYVSWRRRRQRFRRLWRKGLARHEIMVAMAMCEVTVDRWRKDMGLAPRRTCRA